MTTFLHFSNPFSFSLEICYKKVPPNFPTHKRSTACKGPSVCTGMPGALPFILSSLSLISQEKIGLFFFSLPIASFVLIQLRYGEPNCFRGHGELEQSGPQRCETLMIMNMASLMRLHGFIRRRNICSHQVPFPWLSAAFHRRRCGDEGNAILITK